MNTEVVSTDKRIALFSDHNLEMSVLAGVFRFNESMPILSEILNTSDCFHMQRHGFIWAEMMWLYENQKPIDILTVTQRLIKSEALNQSGGPFYLSEINDVMPTLENVFYHAEIVKQKYRRRKLAETGKAIKDSTYDPSQSNEDVMEEAEKALFEIMSDAVFDKTKDMMTLAMEALERAEALKEKGTGITGIPTGFTGLDELTSGLQSPDLIIIAARPGMGKTSIMLAIARNASDHDCHTAIFSLEMSDLQLTQKLISAEGEINSKRVRNGQMTEEEWDNFTTASSVVSELNITIDDTAGLTMQQLRTKCRKLKLQKDIKLIAVDYLQLMEGEGNGTRENDVSAISRGLKRLAKELGVPIIALSQLSRAVETRGGTKRPQLSDLRESGAIEQDADIVSFVYRPEYYEILEDEEGQSLKGVGELIIAKHRNGETGTIPLKFIDYCAKFSNPDDPNFNDLTDADKASTSTYNQNIITRSNRMNDDDIPF